MKPHLAALCAVLALAACNRAAQQPKETAAPAVVPPPAAPTAFAGDFNAAGTEPFWAVEVRATGLKLSRPDSPDLAVANPGPRVEAHKAIWPGKGLVLTLTEGQCSDGMSDKTYPYFAEVTIVDATLKGCATKP